MFNSEAQIYRFSEFQLDAVKRVLLRGNSLVQLPSRAFDVLLALVEHNQRVIDKDELMRMVWGERVVEENNLMRHISTLRKALDEGPNDHRYIVTVPGRGYSFVAEVERAPANGGEILSGNNDNRTLQTDGGANGFRREARPGRSEAAAIELPGVAPAVRKSRIRLWAAVLVLLLVSTALLVKLMHTRAKPAAPNSYRDWEMVKLTSAGGSYRPAISPDGKYVAYVNSEQGRQSIWLTQLATFTQQQLTPPDRVRYFDLLFSPDGSELYFTRDEYPKPRSLYKMPALGGVATKLRDDIHSHIALSADGARLCFTRRNSEGKPEFIISDASGVEERVLAHRRIEYPAWSPDGKAIAFSEGNAERGGEDMSVHEIRLDDGATREISEKRWAHVSHKAWMPDGSGLIVCGRTHKPNVEQLWFVAYPSGDARPLSNDLDSLNRISLSEDARMLVTEQVTSVSDIWKVSLADVADSKKVGGGGTYGLCVLPDGRIVYSSVQPGQYSKAWIMNADGTGQKQLTTTGSINDAGFVASPDGRFIVFASNRTGYVEIWRMNTDGGDLIQLTNIKGSNHSSVSPDGGWVIYTSKSDGYLYKVPIEGGAPRRVAGKAIGASAVSPNGKLIAYIAPGKDTWGIAVSSFKDGSAVRRFEPSSGSLNGGSLKWTPDGRDLLYSVSSDGVANIWMQPLDGGPPRQVTDFKADGIFRFDISADGKTLVCAHGRWKSDIVLVKNLR